MTLVSCSSNSSKQEYKKELKISTNSWIGYTPLYYAKEKGYLDKLNIQLITNVSLAEAANVYLVGNADIVSTTQHEFHTIQKSIKDTVPIILLDRSYGGDMILSNKTLDEIKKAKSIDAYLEIDSINSDLIRDFLHFNKFDKNKFNFINKDQAQIQDLKSNNSQTTLIVTYTPYDIKLKKHGFHEIISTRFMKELVVIDALCTHKQLLKTQKSRLKQLKIIIDKSIKEIQADKQNSYKLVKQYVEGITYKEYLKAFNGIKWINHPSDKLLQRIKPMGYQQGYLIQ